VASSEAARVACRGLAFLVMLLVMLLAVVLAVVVATRDGAAVNADIVDGPDERRVVATNIVEDLIVYYLMDLKPLFC